MKKFLGILAIAGTLVACGNSAEGENTTTDTSTVITQDTVGVVTDTTVTTDTISNPMATDTTQAR